MSLFANFCSNRSSASDDALDIIKQTRRAESEELGSQVFVAQRLLYQSEPLDCVCNISYTSRWFQSDLLVSQPFELLYCSNHAETDWEIRIDLERDRLPFVLAIVRMFAPLPCQSKF